MSETQTSATHPENNTETPRDHHVCPPWIGRLLVSPIRRLVENPIKIFGPYVTPGSTVVEVGCAMGFHSLDLARLVGLDGRVVSLDIQQVMLDNLVKRARRKGVDGIIEPRLCDQEGLGIEDLAGSAELVTALHVVHETAYPMRFLSECASALAPGGRLLISEHRGHVSESSFHRTTIAAESTGLVPQEAPQIWKCFTALFAKPVG